MKIKRILTGEPRSEQIDLELVLELDFFVPGWGIGFTR
jgi:hypothetical protein